MKQNKLQKGKTNIIGITGGIGAGKTTVLEYIKKNYNCKVVYSDDVANEIKMKGYPAYDELVNLLGKEILGEDGEIDRAKMAKAIFGDEKKLRAVNNILHPAVNTYIINIIDEERLRNRLDFVFVEAALLIENGYEDIVDELWYVYASEDVRRQRLKDSRGYSDEKVTDIFKKQLSDDDFREHCDFVLDNSGDLDTVADIIGKKLLDWRR
ncbi:dephospho-CoA kinase [Butyrivibrio sp. XB500-5]|uniref:dephospho-CoA kinase n=1 Tax=Butyrivibrio sp. XB500-5 TaxID=2364880 RepID=UPI000EAA3407|nr:dephospho-CoA kinase [Butyrivibrio sp. XB500-5]RKM62719.1 dephospho-CoA kinase [Butyrivibrio sp. XB500-5]